MSDTNASINMGMPIPIPGVTAGPDYAGNIDASLTIIDSHDHSTGKGVPITPAGMNLSTDLPFLNHNATLLRSARFSVQGSPLALGTDLGCLYVSGVDLYFNDVNGNQVRITQSGGVAGSPGSIASLTSPASATYVAADETFVWQSDASTPANLDCGAVIFRNVTASSNGITVQPPIALGSNYTLTWPAIPGATNIMTMDSSGNMGTALNVDNSTLQIVSSVLSIKNLGVGTAQLAALSVTAAKIAAATITGTQVSSNINLAGKAVQESSKNVVVSNTNATNSLCIVRGAVAGNGTAQNGEGYTSSQNSTGNYTILFPTNFGDTPVPVACVSGANGYAEVATFASTGMTILTFNNGGAAANLNFNFVVVGQRS